MAIAASVLWILIAGILAFYLVVFVAGATGRVLRPQEEFIYGESWLLDDARRIAAGESLYPPVDRLPLMHTAYTPVYYVLVGQLQHVFGDQGYAIGRAVSLLGTALAAVAIGWTVHHLTGSWLPGVFAAGYFLTQNLTLVLWAPLHRVDALALGFTLLGLALATAGRVGASAVVLVVAVMTKQTFLVAPLVTCLALWPMWKHMLRFALIFGGGVVLCVALAQWLTGGWFLWHTVVGNSNEAELDTFSQLMGSFLQFNGVPVLAAAASLVLPSSREERLWRFYFLGTLATLPTVAKIGASSNYWLEITAATSVLLALASHRLARWRETRLIAPVIVAGSLLIAVPGYQANTREASDSLREAFTVAPEYLTLVSDVSFSPLRVESNFVRRVAAEPGEVLTDNPGLAVAAHKRIIYEFQIFQLLHVEGHWAQTPILDAIRARRFSLVALMHPLDGPTQGTRWTPSIKDALQASYVPAGQQSGFWLYRPRQ